MNEQIEKQAIEEMARVIEHTEHIAEEMVGARPSPTMYAKDLYWHGYCKQSVGEWKVDGNDYNRRAQCSNCEKEYAVQRGMLQLHRFPYCPNCGAKMKGGAE